MLVASRNFSERETTVKQQPRTTSPRTTRPRTTRPITTRPRTTRPRTTRPRTARRGTRPRTTRKELLNDLQISGTNVCLQLQTTYYEIMVCDFGELQKFLYRSKIMLNLVLTLRRIIYINQMAIEILYYGLM